MIAPADGRPEFAWTSSGDGSFTEGRVRSDWRDLVANDRQVTFMALEGPGMVTVTASLVDSADCLSQQEDETSEDHEVRCSARVEVNVVRRTTAPIIVKAPVNPPGATPETLSDSEGVANAVFTPVEGGSFAGDGYPLVAGAGAVTNGGIHRGEHGARGRCIERRDDVASLHPQRSALRDRGGGRKRRSGSDYGLNDPVTACVPLPPELRGNIADIVLAVTDDGGGMEVLPTSVKITPVGV